MCFHAHLYCTCNRRYRQQVVVAYGLHYDHHPNNDKKRRISSYFAPKTAETESTSPQPVPVPAAPVATPVVPKANTPVAADPVATPVVPKANPPPPAPKAQAGSGAVPPQPKAGQAAPPPGPKAATPADPKTPEGKVVPKSDLPTPLNPAPVAAPEFVEIAELQDPPVKFMYHSKDGTLALWPQALENKRMKKNTMLIWCGSGRLMRCSSQPPPRASSTRP